VNELKDSFSRRFSYLRLSLTDACNFRCVYCLPHGYQKDPLREDYLNLTEIKHLVTAFSEMGVWKLRLTGGEPMLRRDLLEIVQSIHAVPGVTKIALSTNGYRLKELARALYDAGLRALNVSLDSLNPQRFKEVTGQDQLAQVLSGIDEALEVGFDWVKVNAVLMKTVNADDQSDFFEWIRYRPLSVRFIELMPTGQNQAFFRQDHVRGESLRETLVLAGWTPRPRGEGDGPAQEFVHSDYKGRIGIIAPYANEFCSTCNRLRVTSQGALRLCLFGESNASLRHLLQHPSQKEELKALVQAQLMRKEVSHYLPEGRYGNNHTFSAMGG
jgi:GTP 3',8-cyclase